MPLYLYLDDRIDKIYEVYQGMNDKHEHILEDGYQCQRIWQKPQASFNTKWDALNPQDFVRKTALKRGTYGNITDKSAELSKERERIVGTDHVKNKYIENWQNKRKKQHPETRQKQLKEGLAKKGVDIEA